MMRLEITTPAELIVERTKLEFLLVSSWLAMGSLRRRWTPNAVDFATNELSALARACRWCHDDNPEAGHGEMGLRVSAAFHRLGFSKSWPDALSHVPVQVSGDPDADLERWRKLRCLIAARSSLVETLLRLTPATDPSELNRRILEASSLTYTSDEARVWSDAESLQMAVDSIREPRGVGAFTGQPELDRHTGGIRPGHVWVLGAPTNWGKSSWLIAISERYLSVHSGGVLLITCEDDALLFSLRRLCRRAGIRGTAARDGKVSSSEFENAVAAVSQASARGKAPVLLDGRGRSVEQLSEDISRLVRKHGIQLVLVDYLQCIRSQRETQDRRAEINHIARTLTNVIKTSGCAGVLASQLTGDDIRESRDVEHAAEVVLIGRKAEDGTMSMFIKKNKTGASGAELVLAWDPTTGSFRDQVEDDYGFTDA